MRASKILIGVECIERIFNTGLVTNSKATNLSGKVFEKFVEVGTDVDLNANQDYVIDFPVFLPPEVVLGRTTSNLEPDCLPFYHGG